MCQVMYAHVPHVLLQTFSMYVDATTTGQVIIDFCLGLPPSKCAGLTTDQYGKGLTLAQLLVRDVCV